MRVTAPIVRLAQSGSSAFARASGSALSPKYADLLRARSSPVWDVRERTLTTTKNPLRLPLSAHPTQPSTLPIDAVRLPDLSGLGVSSANVNALRVPILADSFVAATNTATATSTATNTIPSPSLTTAGTIVAANPDQVQPASILTSISGLGGADSVDFKFVHGRGADPNAAEGLGGILRNFIGDILVGEPRKAAPVVA